MRFRTIAVAASVAFAVASVHGADPASRKTTPLKTAWESLIPNNERAVEIESMTSAQRYDHQVKAITAAQKATRGKTFSLRLRCTGVIEPTEKDGLTLVHGQYIGEDYQSLFGKGATIGIWTSDHKTALKLNMGEEFEIQGKVFVEMHHIENDSIRTKSHWNPRAVNTSVAHLRHGITKWVRDARIYMVNPAIIEFPSSSNQ